MIFKYLILLLIYLIHQALARPTDFGQSTTDFGQTTTGFGQPPAVSEPPFTDFPPLEQEPGLPIVLAPSPSQSPQAPAPRPSPSAVPVTHPSSFWRNLWNKVDGVARAVSDKILVAGQTALHDLESGKKTAVFLGKQLFTNPALLLNKIKAKTQSVEKFSDSIFSNLINNTKIEINELIAECKDNTAACIDDVFARVGVSEITDAAALAVGELSAITKHIPELPVIQNIGDGFVGAMAQMVKDMANPFIHPVQTKATLQGFMNSPEDHIQDILDGVKSTCAQNAVKCAGTVVYTVITGGKRKNINPLSGNALQRFADGFVGGASALNQVHPLASAMSLINVVKRPAEAAVRFAKAINESCTNDAAACAGNGVFTIATIVIPFVGEDEILAEAAAFAKLGAEEDAVLSAEEAFLQRCLLLKRGLVPTGPACEAAGIESRAKARIDETPSSTKIPKTQILSNVVRNTHKDQLIVTANKEYALAQEDEKITLSAAVPNADGYDALLLAEMENFDVILKSTNLAKVDTSATTGPVFLGYHGTSGTTAAALLKGDAFKTRPAYWDLAVFKGRDFDKEPLTGAERVKLNDAFDRGEYGPGITAESFANEAVMFQDSEPTVLEVWINGPFNVHEINDQVPVTNGVAEQPWFSYASGRNPPVSEMKSLIKDFDVITGLHIKEFLGDELTRVTMQSKVNPGSFDKVMFFPRS